MRQKRILLFALVLVLLVSIIGVGTFAYFSDTETSTGNSFTAGTLDLSVDNQNPLVLHMTRSNLKPNAPWSHSYGGQWILKNVGSLPGKFWVEIKNVKNLENGVIEPEVESGDTTGGPLEGELGGLMYAKWGENHYGIYSPAKGWTGNIVYNPLNSIEGVKINGVVLNPNDLFSAYLDLEFDTHAGLIDNTAQGDGIEFDVVFHFEQITP